MAQWSGNMSIELTRFFCFDFYQAFFKITNLQVTKEKMLIDSFAL